MLFDFCLSPSAQLNSFAFRQYKLASLFDWLPAEASYLFWLNIRMLFCTKGWTGQYVQEGQLQQPVTCSTHMCRAAASRLPSTVGLHCVQLPGSLSPPDVTPLQSWWPQFFFHGRFSPVRNSPRKRWVTYTETPVSLSKLGCWGCLMLVGILCCSSGCSPHLAVAALCSLTNVWDGLWLSVD